MTNLTRQKVLNIAPVVAVVVVGALLIAFDTGAGLRSTHQIWLSVVLAESAVALLFRRRHPVEALAGVLATFVLFDAPAVSLLPLLVALFTVVSSRPPRTGVAAAAVCAAAVVATALLHDGGFNVSHQGLVPLTALALAYVTGLRLGPRLTTT
jgi:hypothetical protein